jgi:[glutamine synthetase] adenylyltransferase / [glutamine synthetase]-adenylyl-L-tyrosine phosphorylase
VIPGMNFLPESLRPTVANYWQSLLENPDYKSSGLQKILDSDADFKIELFKVWAASEFIAHCTISNPEILIHVFQNRAETERDYPELLSAQLAPLYSQSFAEAAEKLKRLLRKIHRSEFIMVLWRDICGHWDMFETCRQMSRLADAHLQRCLDLLHHWSIAEWGQPTAENREQSMVVIGMGKLGAHELNVSSDIDLIFTYPEAGETRFTNSASTRSDPISNHQFFTRLGQRLIDAMDSRTEHGFVFRMDMRLRPYGSEGALALSFDAMEDYYQNQGRDWERYAMIKARVVAGDRQQGNSLLGRLKPFVYRKYLDFAMFESLRDMKRQINKQARRGKLTSDIKLGTGGIREAEFVVQALQLVHGGKDRQLQHPSIKITLQALVSGEYLPAESAEELLSAYIYLRNLEHKLQALANLQTQRLPDTAMHQYRIAFAMGHKSWEELQQTLTLKRSAVYEQFRDVLRTDEEPTEQKQSSKDWIPVWKMELPALELEKLLEQEGFENARASLEIIQLFRQDKKFVLLPAESRRRLNAFMPAMLDAVAESPLPSLCLERVMPLVSAVSRRTAYLVLLLENPGALQQLVRYCTASPLISDYLTRFPVLLDELLHVLDVPPEKSSLSHELNMQLLRIDEDNFEQQLECLRYFKQSHLLQVAAAEVTGKMPLMKVSDYLTFTAEVILDAVVSMSWQHLVRRHGFPVHNDGSFGEPGFAVVAYGKLGGLELSYNSDLDLVFLHRAALAEDTVTSGSQRKINSREFYTRLAQRIMLMLGTYTMSGKLYEVDMRLRPSGASGLMVSSLESFVEYQQDKAWTWEHQALVRARAITGNKELSNRFMEIRGKILSQVRDKAVLASEVVSMRERMRKELSSKSTSAAEKTAFALKQGVGGIVDIEFLVQFLVLAYSHRCAGLYTYTDNYRILEAASECNLLDKKDMQILIDAYLEMRAMSHQADLRQSELTTDNPMLKSHKKAVAELWDRTLTALLRESSTPQETDATSRH